MADPYTSTRAEFTTALTSQPIPPTSAPQWARLATQLTDLLSALAAHPAMAPNLQQTYMTPADSKNKVYFMWDFVGRTLGYLYMVPPTLSNLSPEAEEKWKDARGRAGYARSLMCDEMPGMLDLMTESTYPGQKGAHPEFGEEVLRIARRLDGE